MASVSWKQVIIVTSLLATLGGIILITLVPNGPFRKAGAVVSIRQIIAIFKKKDFKKAAVGYFGHMWELYAFWALVPVILVTYNERFPETQMEVGLYSFVIIGIGALACVLGGILSEKLGVQKTARRSLLLSAGCCLLSPLLFWIPFAGVVVAFLCFWGMVVIADSPLFSTLVAQRAAPATKGTAITIVTCIGFAVTIVSIQLLALLQEYVTLAYVLPLLAIGPIAGLIATRK
jgi:MFS family permease